MLNFQKKRDLTPYKVRVVDCDGNEEIFDSVRELAELMGVTKPAIFNAVKKGCKVRGCNVYKAGK